MWTRRRRHSRTVAGTHPRAREHACNVTSAAVTVESEGSGFKISKAALELEAEVPSISKEQFGEIAQAAKAGCPVSKVLNADITLDWKLR